MLEESKPPIRTREFTVDPGAITAATGYTVDLMYRSGAKALYAIKEVSIDARRVTAGTVITFTSGDFSKDVPAGVADTFAPFGPRGEFQGYRITTTADIASGVVEIIERGVRYEDHERYIAQRSGAF